MTAVDARAHEEAFEQFRDRFQAALFGSVTDHMDRLTWDRARIKAHQQERLRALLAVAIERSPFHARRLSGVDPVTFELGELGRLPVMTKSQMMCQFDDVSIDRRLALTTAEEAIRTTSTTPRPVDGELVVLASGGSSGTRGLFAFDANGFAEYAATIVRPSLARRATKAASTAGGPTVIVAAASAIHATAAAPPLLAGSPFVMVPVPVTLPVDAIVAQLNQLQPGTLYGYPSILAVLAGERAAGRLQISPVSVTAHSEGLRPSHRAAIRSAFGAPLVCTFGASEGLVGSAPPDDHTMTFASDSCIVELVDEHDTPVPLGTTSAAVLVTNLYTRW